MNEEGIHSLLDAQVISIAPAPPQGASRASGGEAICEAVGRPNMHFVAIKSEQQQSVLMVHRVRTLVVANRTAQVNYQS